VVVLGLKRDDESIEHPADFFDGHLRPVVVRDLQEAQALCDFQLDFDFGLGAKSDVEVIEERFSSGAILLRYSTEPTLRLV
jgi:hypothetical protein